MVQDGSRVTGKKKVMGKFLCKKHSWCLLLEVPPWGSCKSGTMLGAKKRTAKKKAAKKKGV